jgi:hypothetical protein
VGCSRIFYIAQLAFHPAVGRARSLEGALYCQAALFVPFWQSRKKMRKLLVQRHSHFYPHDQQGDKPCTVILLVFLSLLIASCGPSKKETDALATVVAVSIFASQTAYVPTATPTLTPTATATPTRTPTPPPTDTPTPGAVVVVNVLNIREGPGTAYSPLGRLSKDEELDIVGQFENCTWLKVKSRVQSLAGWIAGGTQYIKLHATCESIPLGTFRPLTGVIKPNQSGRGGYGTLTIDNGTDKDGVVILTLNEEPYMAAYIRAGETFTMKNISDGTYYVYFSTGSEWNSKVFLTSPSHQRFEDPVGFTTSSTTYTTWNITMHSVVGGTASTENVSENEFPDIGD